MASSVVSVVVADALTERRMNFVKGTSMEVPYAKIHSDLPGYQVAFRNHWGNEISDIKVAAKRVGRSFDEDMQKALTLEVFYDAIKVPDPALDVCYECLLPSLITSKGEKTCTLCYVTYGASDVSEESDFEEGCPFDTPYNKPRPMDVIELGHTLREKDEHLLLPERKETLSDFAKNQPIIAERLKQFPFQIDEANRLQCYLKDGYVTKVPLVEVVQADNCAKAHSLRLKPVRKSILNGLKLQSENNDWKRLIGYAQEVTTRYNISMTDEAILRTYRYYLKIALNITKSLEFVSCSHRRFSYPQIADTVFYLCLLKFGRSKAFIAKTAKPHLNFNIALFNALTGIYAIANSEPDLSTQRLELLEKHCFGEAH